MRAIVGPLGGSFGRARRRYADGADLSKLLHVPLWLDAVLANDRVAFPLHVLLGRLLNRLDAPPRAAGLEWLKAAAHARSEHALEIVVQGLVSTGRRARADDFASRLHMAVVNQVTCHGRDVTMRRRQLAALERAGMPARTAHDAGSADGQVGWHRQEAEHPARAGQHRTGRQYHPHPFDP